MRREALYILTEFGTPIKLVGLIKMFQRNLQNRIKHNQTFRLLRNAIFEKQYNYKKRLE